MRRVKFGALVPGWYLAKVPTTGEIDEFVLSAERLGFDSLWAISRLLQPQNCLDDLVLLTHAAALTKRVRLGTACLLLMFSNPVSAAKSLSMLDLLSGGRLTVGTSLGGREWEYRALGLTTEKRVSRFIESIKIMRELWTSEKVSFEGKVYKMEGVTMLPKPVQRPIPILIAGMTDASMVRAGRFGDGYIATASRTPAKFAGDWKMVQEAATAAGRDPTKLDNAKILYIFVAKSSEEAHNTLKPWLDAYYMVDYKVKDYCVYGTPDECVQKIQDYLDAGVKNVILGPPTLDKSQLETIRDKVVNRF